jgi:AcrR family transcriptional regulator
MPDQKRTYRKMRRAELEQETRRRITETAVLLHGTLGPARTSIKAVAAHAGVTRSTVYRHFPDEEALFAACSAHWAALNPLPDLARWAAIGDPDERLRSALEELYAFYRATERMMDNLLRDASTVPSVDRRLEDYRGYLRSARDTLARGCGTRGNARRRTLAAIGHALAFSTWRSLTGEEQLGDEQAAELMHRLVAIA